MRLNDDAVRLLRQICTNDQIHELLKRFQDHDDVRLSAENKEALITRNLQNAVEAGVISPEQVFDLIRDAEENGRQHIFYFRCSRRYGSTLLLDAVATNIWGRSWESRMGFPRHDLLERDYQFVDARPWNVRKPQDWVIKIYGEDIHHRFLGEAYESEPEHPVLVKRYAVENRRRVLMMRWNAPDVLELRVPIDEARSRVEAWANRLWLMTQRGIQRSEFHEWDLSTARRQLITQWDANSSHQSRYTFRDTLIVDPYHTAATFQPHSPQGHLYSSEYARAAIQGLLESDSECPQITVTWLKQDDGRPSKNLNTELGLRRRTNELIIREHCTAKDVDYVTEQLRFFNRQAS